MTVLLDARLGRRPTGIGNYVTSLATELGPLANGEVRVVCRPRHAARFRGAGLRPIIQIRGEGLPRRLASVQLVHGPNFHAPRHPTAPGVATVHDLGYVQLPECHPPGMPERLDRLVRAGLPRTRMFLCDSRDTADAFMATYDVGPDRCRVVPLGVDTRVFSPVEAAGERAGLRNRYRIDRPYVLFVGAMVPRKDLRTLLDAWGEVASDRPDLGLVLVGSKMSRWASDWPRVADWIQENPRLAPRVHVLDYVAARDLPSLYRGSEAMMLTSLLEGFGLPVLEAMACDRPVVVTNSGALPEIGGSAAYYGQPRDPASFAQALRAALAGEGRVHRSAEARAIVSAHTWHRTAELTFAAYREALA